MATMAGVRSRVRLRLEEESPAIWIDDEIDEAITATLDEYNTYFPHEKVTEIAVDDGDRSVELPGGTRSVVRVGLADGRVLPRRGAPDERAGDERQAWEVFGGELLFSRPLVSGTVTIWHHADHEIGDVPARDEGMLALGAVWRALQQRSVQDMKRRGSVSYDLIVRQAGDEYRALLDARRRRLRVRLV